MRKWMPVLVCFFFLTACSTKDTVSTAKIGEQYASGFSTAATVTTEEDTLEMTVTKNGMSITVFVEKPEELRGLSIQSDLGKTKVTFEGMEKEFVTERLPKEAPFRLLGTAFSVLETGEGFSAERTKEGVAVFGDGFSGVLSPEDLSLFSLSFPAEKTEVSFSDFRFSEEK